MGALIFFASRLYDLHHPVTWACSRLFGQVAVRQRCRVPVKRAFGKPRFLIRTSMLAMERQSMEIPSGLPHFQGLDEEIRYFVATIKVQYEI